jgi:hypothetical protein
MCSSESACATGIAAQQNYIAAQQNYSEGKAKNRAPVAVDTAKRHGYDFALKFE